MCYTDCLITHIKTEDFYRDIAPDGEKWFDTSGYIVDRPLPMGKNKKVLGIFKDELGGKIMIDLLISDQRLIPFLIDDFEEKKRKEQGSV